MGFFAKLVFFVVFVVSAQARELTLSKAIEIGLKNNHEHKISQMSLEIARTQFMQAQSALYPSFDITMNATRRDEGVAYSLKGNLPLPAGLGGGALPVDLDTTILGRDTVLSSINMNYALYSGGKISSIINQTKLNKKLMKKNIERTKEDMIFDIKKYFYSYVLANDLYENAYESFQRMKIVEELTKGLYEGDSLKVKKTDYLRVQVITSLIELTMHRFHTSKELAKSALIYSIGLSWKEKVELKDNEKVALNTLNSLDKLVQDAHEFNVDLQKIKLALHISEEKIKEAKSAFYPQVGIHADVQNMYNSYEYGLNNDQNKNSWTLGIGIKIPLFDGNRDKYKVEQRRIEKKKNSQMQLMIEDAVAMKIKHALIEFHNGKNQIKILGKTKSVARQNTQLNIQGYQIDMIETADVIQAQLIQSYANADYSKSLYDYKLSLAKLNKLVGKEVLRVSHGFY
jgi:outer membrane protein TolC